MRTRSRLRNDASRTPSAKTPSHSTTAPSDNAASETDASSNTDRSEAVRNAFNLRRRPEETVPSTESDRGSEEDLDAESDAESSDVHEDACVVCHESTSPEKLLCCDHCPRVYHLHCLDPPLSRVPKGEWSCPHCSLVWSVRDVERILAENSEKREYYVKWKDLSHRHCTWIGKATFQAAKKVFSFLHTKQRAFESKEEEDIELEAYNPNEFENGVHKDWLTVEKVLETDGPLKKMYFVKWKGLGYEHCTWEDVEEIGDAQEQIDVFLNEISIRQDARLRVRAKHSKDQLVVPLEEETQFTETPAFLREGCALHPYQLEGLNWLKFKWDHEENIILADEMGLGKTIQAIAFLAALWDEGVHLPHLIVVPLSTMQNWLREFETWAPQLKVVAVIGSRSARETVLKHEIYLSKHLRKNKKRERRHKDDQNRRIRCHVILASYEVVSLEASKLSKIEYECLIVDEGHRLKAKSSRLVKELNNYECHHRTLLTGTPLQNNIQELFALLHFIDARKFDCWESFEADFAQISQEDQVKKLHALLSPHLLRRLKKDVLKDLPPKKEQIVRVEMTEAQREMYKSILARNFHLLVTDKKNEQARRGLLSVVTELRKCCAHPYLFEGVENMNLDKAEELQQMIQVCGKLLLLDKMLARLKERGHRVLIYSQFVIMLNILEDYLELRGYGHLRIDGSVNGSDRQPLIDAYNTEQEKYFVFLLSTRSGGLGINLATADTVILYDSDYNPHNDIQAQARAHRLGQERPVMIYRLVTRLTIEERMMQLAKEKLVLEQIVVRKMGNEELKQAELDGILRYGAAELFADDRLADKQTKGMTVTEQEKAKMLADSSAARIVYDEEALEKLLDRSDMTTAEEDKMEVENGELMEGFKIANFEVAEKEENGISWESLLQHRTEVQTMKEKEKPDPYLITPGRRRRRNEVVYKLDDAGSDDSLDSEYNGDGQEPEESESTDLDVDLEVGHEVDSRVKKQRVAPVEHGPPKVKKPEMTVISWNGPELMILGFGQKERQLFLNLLLRFGFPDGALDGIDTEWTEFTNRLPRKKHPFIDDYARVLVTAAGGQLPVGVKMEEMLFESRPEDLLTKIGMMHLFRKKLRSMICHPSRLWISSLSTQRLYTTKFWKEAQDWALIRAVVRFGHGRWKDYLNNGEHQLEVVLHQELGLEPPSGQAIDLSGSPSEDGLEFSTKKQKLEEESEAAKKSRLRSIETRCRTWLAGRLKILVDFMSAEQDSAQKQSIQQRPPMPIAQQAAAATLVVTGSLKWKFEGILRQCAAVRECSNAVSGKQSLEQLQAAGTKFRDQMKTLGDMAKSLKEGLPDDYDDFQKLESQVRLREVQSTWRSPVQNAIRLDSTLGTVGPRPILRPSGP